MQTFDAQLGGQGKHRFYTGAMRWGELDRLLVFPDDLGDLDDDERMQRGLAKKRIGDLVGYLTEADDHFFSALTLIILPRDFSRSAEEGEEANGEWDYYFEREDNGKPGQQRSGQLFLSGDVRLFPADGMHRAKAAIEAIKIDHTLAREEVPVVLIPYEGQTQVRQLFSDLNLNAKPVSKTIGYDFESRDRVVVITKDAASQVPLFDGRMNRRSNSLPRSSSDVITLSTLVQGSRWVLESLAAKDTDEQNDHDEDESIVPFDVYLADRETATRELADVWHVMTDVFSTEWKDVMHNVDGAAGLVRETYLFAHGLGWLGLSKAASELIAAYGDGWEPHFRKAVASLDWQRTAPEWRGNAVLVNEEADPPQYRVNNTAPAVKDLAARIVNKA